MTTDSDLLRHGSTLGRGQVALVTGDDECRTAGRVERVRSRTESGAIAKKRCVTGSWCFEGTFEGEATPPLGQRAGD